MKDGDPRILGGRIGLQVFVVVRHGIGNARGYRDSVVRHGIGIARGHEDCDANRERAWAALECLRPPQLPVTTNLLYWEIAEWWIRVGLF